MRYAIVLLMMYALNAGAQNNNIAIKGENYIVLNGGKFKNKKIAFTRAEGDWFVTNIDTHGQLTIYAAFDSREIRLDIEWDGNADPHIVNEKIRHNGKHSGEFVLTVPDKDVYGDGLNAYPSGDQQVKISVTSIDDTTATADIAGMITNSNDPIRVEGKISLIRKDVAKKAITDSYKDCDNVIHDKLTGTQFRTPTECEINFDGDLRKVLHLAFQPLVDSLLKTGWQLVKESSINPITGIGRGSEKNYFDPGLSDAGNYSLQFQMNPRSPEFKNWQNGYNDIIQDFQKNAAKPGSMDKLTAYAAAMKAASEISIHVSINHSATSTVNFSNNHLVEKIPNTAFVVHLKNAQAASGGGKDDSGNAVWVYFGRWSSPKFQHNDDGSERVGLSSTLSNFASHLSVQTLVLRLQCSDELVKELLKDLDIQKLATLLHH